MEKLRILLTLPLPEEDIRELETFDPRVEVIYAMEEVRAELSISRTSQASLIHSARQRDISPQEAAAFLDKMLAQTDVIFGWRLPKKLLPRAPRLKWVQSSAVGIDLFVGDSGLLESEVIITNTSGINTSQVAEAAIGFMFMLAKKAPALLANQKAHRWQPLYFADLKGKTVGILGLGRIGLEVARLARALGIRVLAATKPEEYVSGADEVFPPAEIIKMVPRCDYFILTVPLTAETKGIIGYPELAAMKKSAYLINVSRGAVVRESELVNALKQGCLAGAALDVFEKEPLPPESELWGMPNVIISPHAAGMLENYMSAAAGLFKENLKRYLAGQGLLNVFNKKRGY